MVNVLNFIPFSIAAGRSTISLGGDTDSIASDIAPLPNPPVYMPYSGTYNPSHGYQPIQYGCTDRHISSGEKNLILFIICETLLCHDETRFHNFPIFSVQVQAAPMC